MEPRIGLAEAARLMRPGLNPVTVNRWILVGVRRPDGSRFKLRADRVGSRWVTTEKWVREFLDAHTNAFVGSTDASFNRSRAQRSQASDAASDNLAKAGW
jgi:hypothetical protein